MWTFGLIMLVGNGAFLKPEEVRAALRGILSLARRPKTIEYDPARAESLRWATLRVALRGDRPVLLAAQRASATSEAAGSPSSALSHTGTPSGIPRA